MTHLPCSPNERTNGMVSTSEEIAQLQKRLSLLQEQAEEEIRQKLKEARAVVHDLEQQLSEITGRPTA